MASTYYSIPILDTTIADIVTALNANSLITQIKYQSTGDLIFTTPISAKYIKINNASGRITMWYGDGWTSGTSLTGTVVQINGYYTSPTCVGLHMIADTTFFAFVVDCGGDSNVVYMGATDSGKNICFGMYCGENWSHTTNQGKNITDNSQIYPLVFSRAANDSGNVISQKLMWFDASSGQIIKNGSDPAGTIGVKNCAVVNGAITKGSNYIITRSIAYMNTIGAIPTGLLLEW